MKPSKFLTEASSLISTGLVVCSMLFFSALHSMNGHTTSPKTSRKVKHERLLKVIRENNLVEFLKYIYAKQADQSIVVEAPEGEATYIEHALAHRNSPEQITLNTEEDRQLRDRFIQQLVYYGFPLPKDQCTRAQLGKVLTGMKALVILGTPEEVEASLQEAARNQENMLVPVTTLLTFVVGQRRRSIIELLIRHGANREDALSHLKNLKKLPIFKQDIKEKYAELQVSIENYRPRTAITLGDYITPDLRASL